jgi:hypothetical protein
MQYRLWSLVRNKYWAFEAIVELSPGVSDYYIPPRKIGVRKG